MEFNHIYFSSALRIRSSGLFHLRLNSSLLVVFTDIKHCQLLAEYKTAFRFVSVVMQDFSVGATGSSVTRGNMAVLRCLVPSFVRDFLSVTSWLQDQKFNIYPSSDGGNERANIWVLFR
jgi:hypothetical protein